MTEVKTVLDGEGEDRTKCHTLHRRYQALVREYKRLDRRLVECQKKQLEVYHTAGNFDDNLAENRQVLIKSPNN